MTKSFPSNKINKEVFRSILVFDLEQKDKTYQPKYKMHTHTEINFQLRGEEGCTPSNL